MADFLVPDWPVPPHVKALQTLRQGGESQGPYASLNLGDHVGDAPAVVQENRMRVSQWLGAAPLWLNQVHGTEVVDAHRAHAGVSADAAFTQASGVACAVMTADCLPVLFCDEAGSVVAAAHAGWRGLCDGVLEKTVLAMGVPANRILAWLGPAIGPLAFEVGGEVRSAFMAAHPSAESAFKQGKPGKWLADLEMLARRRLELLGLAGIYGGGMCTYSDAQRFFSYRRDGVTGRMASFIWLDAL